MDKFLLLLAFLSLWSCSTPLIDRLPSSIILTEEEGVIQTKSGLNVAYSILKPSGENLPVVYYLHGRGNSRHMFRDLQGAKAMKDYLEAGGRPFAVVSLTGTFEGKDTYWVNDADVKGIQIKDIILQEMIPEIERQHKIGGKKKQRMIAGISMGSHGAFQLALNSRQFQCVAGHSLVVRDYKSMKEQFGPLFGTLKDFKKRDPLSLLKKERLRTFMPFEKVWIDIGGKDHPDFIKWAQEIEIELQRLAYSENKGDYFDIAQKYPASGHDYPYWIRRMPEYLEWYGQCFK